MPIRVRSRRCSFLPAAAAKTCLLPLPGPDLTQAGIPAAPVSQAGHDRASNQLAEIEVDDTE
ncbi:hypothetical protein KTAU_05930 [Thermogemmatispora aurantia]|uniref:Uncharacterized protein n=1 Tax=Thermogemmatispora aurantia TaxID=2045279 RepID=A0A5J4K2S1_9CHLR|nr:hypothetical protein KTAU_05930 [Thermogemmatispora aurantia]